MDHSSRALAAAGALFFDEAGRVLLVEPTYKPYWEIPGGAVEHGETPSQACRREVEEELGLVREPGRLLVVDWAPRDGEDRVLFVFEGGLITTDDHIVLRAEELKACEFVTPAEAARRLFPDSRAGWASAASAGIRRDPLPRTRRSGVDPFHERRRSAASTRPMTPSTAGHTGAVCATRNPTTSSSRPRRANALRCLAAPVPSSSNRSIPAVTLS